MRRVKCGDCGKIYDFDRDDFCPRCGAFTQPPRTSAIDASGAVIRVDGINERGHQNSFTHEEFHEENRERRRNGLSKGVRRSAPKREVTAETNFNKKVSAKTVQPFNLIFIIILAIIVLNFLSSFLLFFL